VTFFGWQGDSGPGGKYGSLPPGNDFICRLNACTPGSAPDPTLINDWEKFTFKLPFPHYANLLGVNCILA